MAKHTQTIRLQQPTNYLSVFDYFAEFTIKALSLWSYVHTSQSFTYIPFSKF